MDVLISGMWICTRTRLRRAWALGRIEHGRSQDRASASISHVVNLESVLGKCGREAHLHGGPISAWSTIDKPLQYSVLMNQSLIND